jgi:signal transduction histidine kinase
LNSHHRTPTDRQHAVVDGSAGRPLAVGGGEPDQRSDFLAAAGEALAESLDYQETLQRIARLAVPDLADWCVVDTLDERGAISLLAVAHSDPQREATVRELRARYPFDPRANYGLSKVLRSGDAELYPCIDPSWRRAVARDDDHFGLMELLDARSSMCVPLRARGNVLGAMTFVRVAPHRPYGEHDLALAGDLARRCALALDNARLYSQLQQTLQNREAFVASLVHDLKNPLTATLGYAQLLKRLGTTSAPPALAPRLVEGAAKIEANSIKMRRLLDGLLDVIHLEVDQPLQLVPAPVDLVRLCHQAVAEYKRSASPRLIVEAHLPELIGQWDAARLERVLDNLLSNAVKYTPPEGEVRLRIAREAAWAILVVADTGLGIPAADLPHITERFYRARNVEGKLPGTGLGLAGVRQIVEQHGGSLSLESHEGVGTSVTVRLPLA